MNSQNANGSRNSLERLCSVNQGETQEQKNRMDRITKQGDDLVDRNPTSFDRMWLSPANKKLYDIASNSRAEATQITLGYQNKALDIVGRGTLEIVGETVNTTVETSRVILQSTAAAVYREHDLAKNKTLMDTTLELSELMEAQIKAAQGRPPITQNMIGDELELMANEWTEGGRNIQNEFSRIKKDRIVF